MKRTIHEFTGDIRRVITISTGTYGGMAVAEAWRASELIIQGEIEIAWLAFVALSSFHIQLARAATRVRVATRLVIQ